MKNKDMTFLQRLMEEMDSDQLNALLQEELQKDIPDGDAVRMALRVLESRETVHTSEFGRDTEEAWKKYQANSKTVRSVPIKRHSAVLKAATIVLILGVLFCAIPQTARASGLFDRIVQWTDSFFELLTPGDDVDNFSEYVFNTDNPGLQQVYDAVVELGVTEPVVPMWLPGLYELVSCEVDNKTDWVSVASTFANGEAKAVININIWGKNAPSSYFKDERDIEFYEANGIECSIVHNDDLWVAVWVQDNVECFITLDCQEEELYRILNSIYSMEGQ